MALQIKGFLALSNGCISVGKPPAKHPLKR